MYYSVFSSNNDQLIYQYLQKIQTNYLDNGITYYIDYYIFYDNITGCISLFYDTSTWSNFYNKMYENNSRYLQYLDKLSLNNNKDIKPLNKFVDDYMDSYFSITNNHTRLEFISNNRSIPSWYLVLNDNLYVTNIINNPFIYTKFTYNINDSSIYDDPNHTINNTYIDNSTKNKSNTFNYLVKNYHPYKLQYTKAYIYNNSNMELEKADKTDDSNSDIPPLMNFMNTLVLTYSNGTRPNNTSIALARRNLSLSK